jgi:diguanylate cyclase (GGDEF)-like protein
MRQSDPPPNQSAQSARPPERAKSERPPEGEGEWRALLEGALGAVLEAGDEGVIVFDRTGRCRMMGRRVGELFGVEPQFFIGKLRPDVMGPLSRACDEPSAFLDALGADDSFEPPIVISEIDLVHPRPRKIVWTSFPILRQGAPAGRLQLVRDVTRERAAERALKQSQNRLEQLVPVDSLTGLPNARRFREELEREHGRSTRAWDSYGLIRLDVDGMQRMNDELGVPVGDVILERVGECLDKSRREYDLVARFEGDEFAVLLPGADRVAAQAVAERMVTAVSLRDFELADERRVTVSAGGCVWVPPSGETGEDILRRARGAVEDAKGAGRGRVVIDATSA